MSNTQAKRKGRGRMSPRRIAQADARRKALEMRRKGHSFDEIAVALGYSSRASAWHAVVYELECARQESVDGMRQTEGGKLRTLQDVLWPRCLAVDLEAIKVFVAVSRRLSRLFGLDVVVAPPAIASALAQVTIQIGSGEQKTVEELSEAELVTYINHLQQAMGETPQLPPPAGDGDKAL